MDIDDKKDYEVINPNNGLTEIWSGQKLRVFKNTYNAEVKFPPPKKKVIRKQTTRKSKK